MATLSQLSWMPDPAIELPIKTTVKFTVSPNGSSVQIQYTLQSPELRFVLAAAASDCAASQPVPTSSTAGASEILDAVSSLTGPTPVVRFLTIEQAGSTKPGIARLRVCVSDDETSCRGTMITFNLK